MPKIIAVVGMTGSGKSEVSAVLKEKGMVVVRFGDVTMDVLREKGLEINEKNERMAREQIRKDHGMAGFAILNKPKLEVALKVGDVAADGLYSWEEYEMLKNDFADDLIVIAIYSSPKTRYERLAKRKERPLTNEEAASRDKAEIENSHKAGPIAMADYTIINEGSMDDLRKSMEKILRGLQ